MFILTPYIYIYTISIGEDLDQASMREVFEETGIKTKYCNTIAFRYS